MDQYTELLAELIKMKSVSANVDAVNRVEDRMMEFLSAAGLFCTMEIINGRHTLYASTEEGKTPDYLLNAHLDVVPGTEEQFVPRIEGGRMYARGTEDCLGGSIVAAKTLVALKGKASCGAIFTADEEIGGETTRGMVKRGYGAKECIIIIDAMYDKLVYFQKGIIELELIARSKTGGGHASYPWEFDNPIDRLAEGYLKLRKSWKNPTREAQWSNSMTPCMFHAGSAYNQIPDTATIALNIRYMEPEDREKIIADVKAITGCDEIREIETCPPVGTDPNAPVIQKLLAVMSRHFGREIPLVRMNGATDARHFQSLNIPIAMIGVDGNGEHSPCEYMELDSIGKVSEILQDLIG